MFNVDWSQFLENNLLRYLRKPKRLAWLRLLLSELRALWALFIEFRSRMLYQVNHTGQVMYLQKVLNDVFDPEQRRIIVSDGAWRDIIHIYQRVEKLPLMIYWRWNESVRYRVGDLITWYGRIYEARLDNERKNPLTDGDTWKAVGDHPLIQFREEYFSGPNFLVLVPSGLAYNQDRMKSLINFYRLAGRSYQIKEA